MNEQLRAFTPKTPEAPVEEKPEENGDTPESVEEPVVLNELAVDEKEVQAFEYYFKKITSGDIRTVDEFEARVEARVNINGYLRDRVGNSISDGKGGFVQLPTNERIPLVNSEQRAMLVALLEGKPLVETKRRNTELDTQALGGFLGLIQKKKILGGVPEIEARLAGRVNTNGYLRDRVGNSIPDGKAGFVQLATAERFTIKDVNQKELLESLFLNTCNFQAEKELVDREKGAFSRLADIVISKAKEITPVQFEARLAGRVNVNGYLRDRIGDSIPDGKGGFVQVPGNERVVPNNSEEKEIITGLYELLNGPTLTDEEKANLDRYLKTKNPEDLERLFVFLRSKENDVALRVEQIIEGFERIKRIFDLKASFYQALVAEGDIEKSLAILADFRPEGNEDVQLLVQFRKKIFDQRRITFTEDFVRKIQQSAPFDEIIASLDPLNKSSIPEDRECGQVLTAQAYRFELTKYESQATQMISLDRPLEDIYAFLDTLPIRPTVQGIDYIEVQQELREKIGEYYNEMSKITRLKKINEIRRNFSNRLEGIQGGFSQQDVENILGQIDALPDESQEEMTLKMQLLESYKAYLASERPGDFDQNFKDAMVAKLEAKVKARFAAPELGKNKEAFRYLRDNFVGTIFPLVESFRDDPRTKDDVNDLLEIQSKDGQRINPRLPFIQRLTELEKQRPLTDLERNYLESVELLTLFNPYLVATATADFGVTSEFLNHHFEVLSQNTLANLKDGDYVPLIHVGLGPDGMAAFGELVRNKPDLAAQTLVVDAGERPGGPFAIPNGPAWELNSANRRGVGGYTMPEKPGKDELETVRAYGSPVARWYPGERARGNAVRQGSINTTVDYLPAPDDLSTARYPTNEELQVILAQQAAMLIQKMALNTRLVSDEPNPDPDSLGEKIVTLETMNPDGTTRTLRLRTDGDWIVTGLGDPTFGFKFEGSRAKNVIEQTKDSDRFPKISPTLEAFKGLADRTAEKKSPGKSLGIWGKGNSADTLVEFIGNLFQGDNPLVRDVTKIYIFCEGDLSSRPRYALISDLKPRNGRGNLIELVNARVTDVDFATQEGDPADREMILYGGDSRPITDGNGDIIKIDSGIAAAGFRSSLDSVFKAYLEDGKSTRDEGPDAPLQPLTLPTDGKISVAETLRANPNTLIMGTASKPGFNSFDKLAQLPTEAREALLRNGAENAVAIGFRAPDTQAAVNIWLNTRTINLAPQEPREKRIIPLEGDVAKGVQQEIACTVDPRNLKIPNNVEQEDLLLSPLLAYNLGNQFDLQAGDFTGSVEFDLTFNPETNQYLLVFTAGDVASISKELFAEVVACVNDNYFQRYALSLLSKRRRDPKLMLSVAFKSGKMNPRNTYVETK